MSTIRERAADAGIRLIGEHGVHALTHGRVDAAAGVPRGSTSNHFRTRAALLHGVVERLIAHDRLDWDRFGAQTIASADALVTALTAFVEHAGGDDRVRTVARYALFVDAATTPELAAAIATGRRRIEDWAADVLAGLGAPDARLAATTLTAALDGLILHRVATGEDRPVRAALEPVVRALLDQPAPTAGA